MNGADNEAEESAFGRVLGGRSLLEIFRPRGETMMLLEELRRNPETRAILDRRREAESQAVEVGDGAALGPRPASPRSTADERDVLSMVGDYANGASQEDIARKWGLYVQTVRKRLKAAGAVTRQSNVVDEQELNEARRLLRRV